MKKLLLISTIAFVALAGCKKDNENGSNGKVKLLETLTIIGGETAKYEYDSQNRLTKCSVYYKSTIPVQPEDKLIYDGDDLIEYVCGYETEMYTKSAGKITYRDVGNSIILELNSDGTLAKRSLTGENGEIWSTRTYQYQNGNLMKETTQVLDNGVLQTTGTYEYKYDNKNSPYLFGKTPKWWLILHWGDGGCGSKNNITEFVWKGGKDVASYEYDDDGYPTKCTKIGSDGHISVREYTYITK